MMEYMVIVVLSIHMGHVECAAQAEREQTYLEDNGEELVAVCIKRAPYAPVKTIRPITRK
jgi:hypothetical protein